MMRLHALPLLLIAAVGCQPAAVEQSVELTEADRAAIAAEVDAAAAQWWAAWEVVDFDAGMSFIDDAPEAAWASGDGLLYGHSGIHDAWVPWADALQKQEIEFGDPRTIVLTRDLVYTIRQYTTVQTHATGVVSPELKGIETLVWARRDDGWKVLLGHESQLQETWQAWLDYQASLPDAR